VLILINKVIDAIEENEMLQDGDKVVVGVSGGPDSMCLLHVLLKLRDRFSLELIAAHVNHGLRGKDADDDARYVEEFCRTNDVEFRFIKEDIHKISAERNVSDETAGREIRYEFFERLKLENDADKIAIAHNLNDQAETVMMRIMRGTGLEGLVGIKPVRDGVYIRPLLTCARAEIEDYCSRNGISPRIDKTNFESIYARNKIRLELIPYIEKNFNTDIINVLNRLAKSAKVDSEYLEQEIEKKYKKYCKYKETKVIITKEAFLEHEAVLTRLIRMGFAQVLGNLRNFERMHIYQVIELQRNVTGKKLMLPNGVTAFNNYGDISIYIKGEPHEAAYKTTGVLKLRMGINELKELGLRVMVEQYPAEEVCPEKDESIKCFDSSKVNGDITLRFRKPGDKFNPLGMSGSKKLKDIFIDMKVPQDKRDKTPLICFGDNIAWIVGYKTSDGSKIDKSTKTIIKIRVEREEQ
jgi:tRNA(Ile)-lysidine synthase